MEAVGSSKPLVHIYQTVRCHIPEFSNFQEFLLIKSAGVVNLFAVCRQLYMRRWLSTRSGTIYAR
jgi:hypothetical protein